MLAPILVASALLTPALLTPAPVHAIPVHAAAPAPTALCTPTDAVPAELSGLSVRGEVLLAVGDGGDSLRVQVLDPRDCATVGILPAQQDPFDAEDMAIGADGTVWLADTGDNRRTRRTAGLSSIWVADDGSVRAAAPTSTTPSPPSSPLKAPGTTSSQGIEAWQAAIIAVLVAGALVWLVGIGRRRRR